MGLYFLFPACKTFQQIQTEKKIPYELTATTENGNIDLNTLMQIEGVEQISPVVNLNTTLSLEEYKLDCEIRAVYSSFLNLKFTQGTMYPDSSNMPYLIINEAAAKSFTNEKQAKTVSIEDTVMINMGGTDRKAIVCGIFDNSGKTPTVYMSYDVAQKMYSQTEHMELIFLLENKGAVEDAASALRRQNIYANFDPILTLSWNLLKKQCWQTIMFSLGMILCATLLIREKRISEMLKSQSETVMLLLSGMTENAVSSIYPLRIAFTGTMITFIVTLIALFAGKFSLTAVGVTIFAVGAIVVATYPLDLSRE